MTSAEDIQDQLGGTDMESHDINLKAAYTESVSRKAFSTLKKEIIHKLSLGKPVFSLTAVKGILYVSRYCGVKDEEI